MRENTQRVKMSDQVYNSLVNEVEARGRFLYSKTLKNGNVWFRMVTKSGDRDSFPSFVCKAENLPEGLTERQHIVVRGYVVDRKAKNAFGKIVVTQYFVATEIRPDVSMTEETFGMKGAFFYPPSVGIKISGIISNVIMEEEWVRFAILTNGKKKTKNPASIRISMPRRDRPVEYHVGDLFFAVGVITTKIKEVNGQKVYYEDIIANDVSTKEIS